MGASSELPHGGRGGRTGRTRLLRLGRHLRHLEVLTRSARRAAALTFALAVAAAFLLPGGQGDRLGSSGALRRRLHVRLAAAWLRLGPRNCSGIAAAPILRLRAARTRLCLRTRLAAPLAGGQALWEGDRHVVAAVSPRKEADVHIDGAFAVKDHGHAHGLGEGRPRVGTRRGGGRRGKSHGDDAVPHSFFFFFLSLMSYNSNTNTTNGESPERETLPAPKR